jgi:AraC family transcriptional regulator, transcriptional activator of pobA
MPEHPLISLVDYTAMQRMPGTEPVSMVFDFYSVSLKRDFNAKIKYGQQEYDFDEGILFFMAPGQVFSIEHDPTQTKRHSGWMLLLHPDFLWNTALAKCIKQYEYFDYATHEALFVSDKEEVAITHILHSIRHEYQSNIDRFSQDVIIAQLELLFTYADRFYNRQFFTRKISSHKILERLESLLQHSFNDDDLINKGLPTVQYVADSLHVSPGYLSGLLKALTGRSTQQHIHDKLIEKAKEKLSSTELSIGEIAYQLGFEHSQSFSKLFKSKTETTPLAYRQSFN